MVYLTTFSFDASQCEDRVTDDSIKNLSASLEFVSDLKELEFFFAGSAVG